MFRAEAYMKNKTYGLAQADAKKCLELGGTADCCRMIILECCVELGQVAEGRAVLRHLSSNKKTDSLAYLLNQMEPLFNQALALANSKQFAEAEKVIDRYCYFVL